MEQKKYVLVKLNTGETLVGSLVVTSSKKYTTIENPFIYQIISITNPFGMKVKDLLSFKRWFDFTDETHINFLNTSIVSIAPANVTMVAYYEKELQHLTDLLEKQKTSKPEEPTLDNSSEEPPKGIIGNLNLNFNFDDPEQFNMFMENIQMGLDGLLDEIEDEMDGEEDDDFDMEDDVDAAPSTPPAPKQPAKRKRAKNRIAPKESFDLPYDENGDPKDPKSWSNNPEDYLK
jgi:hypothetical protein